MAPPPPTANTQQPATADGGPRLGPVHQTRIPPVSTPMGLFLCPYTSSPHLLCGLAAGCARRPDAGQLQQGVILHLRLAAGQRGGGALLRNARVRRAGVGGRRAWGLLTCACAHKYGRMWPWRAEWAGDLRRACMSKRIMPYRHLQLIKAHTHATCMRGPQVSGPWQPMAENRLAPLDCLCASNRQHPRAAKGAPLHSHGHDQETRSAPRGKREAACQLRCCSWSAAAQRRRRRRTRCCSDGGPQRRSRPPDSEPSFPASLKNQLRSVRIYGSWRSAGTLDTRGRPGQALAMVFYEF